MITHIPNSMKLDICTGNLRMSIDLNKRWKVLDVINTQTGTLLAEQSDHTLTVDRQVIDLSEPDSCQVDVKDISDDHLTVHLTVAVPDGTITIKRHLYTYPDIPVIRMYDLYCADFDGAGLYYSDLINLRVHGEYVLDCVNYFSCTDQSNNRLQEFPAKRKNRASHLLARNEGNPSDSSMFFYKEGPAPDNQPIPGDYDFVVDGNAITAVGLGFDSIHANETRRANGIVFGLTEHPEALPELRQYQALRYHLNPSSVEFLANSWPAFHTNINEELIDGELDAAAATGVDVVFIDDGWFKPFMGDIDPAKFPEGFAKLAKKAQEKSIAIGLWMNPFGLSSEHPKAKLWDGTEAQDSVTNNVEWNWVARSHDFVAVDISQGAEGDCYYAMDMLNEGYFQYIKQKVADMYRDYGIRHYKFDLYKLHVLHTLSGDPNQYYEAYRRLLSELQEDIPGLTISMDITRRSRPSFDFALDYGRLFMENRGRNHHPDDHRYYQPYIALGNLWNTAKYAPAQKVEVEIMPQIDDYPLEYILSTALFANPLYWGSLADLPSDKAAAIKAFFDTMAPHRERIMSGMIMPIGEMPKKGNISAFMSCPVSFPESRDLYVGVYRNGSDHAHETFSVPMLADHEIELTNIGDPHDRVIVRNGSFDARVESPFGYKLYRTSE